MTGSYNVTFQHHRSSIQGLPPENSAESAVVLLADLFDNVIHRPTVKVLVGQHSQRQLVLLLVAFDRLQRVIAISYDTIKPNQMIITT